MELLREYIIALTHLYGIVSVEQVVTIYNQQNEDQVEEEDAADYLYEDLSTDFVYDYEEYFVHETIMEFDEFDSMMGKKRNKPHYVPEKQELLKYVDDQYYEKPKQHHDLLAYMKTNFFPTDDEDRAETLCQHIIEICQTGFDIQQVVDYFNIYGINFQSKEQVNELLQKVTELASSVRLWENNGHTPREIFETMERPHLKPLPAAGFPGIAGRPKLKLIPGGAAKPGRNDPCPCGSGKKYKKCCLGKQE